MRFLNPSEAIRWRGRRYSLFQRVAQHQVQGWKRRCWTRLAG